MIPRVFIGYDPDEALAYSVLAHSILRHASGPVSITPLALHQLQPIYSRVRDSQATTAFVLTRFLVPYLCDFTGWAIYMDCDMLCRRDIYELWNYVKDSTRIGHPVHVVQHAEQPHALGATKFLGRPQSTYPRKNWSSMMLFNNYLCSALTPQYVDTASVQDLHRFRWLEPPIDSKIRWIGDLPSEWNHLVGIDSPRDDAALVHFTLGMPFFHGYNECEYATEWRAALKLMMSYEGSAHG